MNRTHTLEREALAAFNRGELWTTFWQRHSEQVRKVEPWNRERFGRLYRRLMAIVASGDANGTLTIGDDLEPWEQDDQPSPHDGCPPPVFSSNYKLEQIT